MVEAAMKQIIKFFRDQKLRNKLIAIYFCVGLLPLVIIGVFNFTQLSKMLLQQEETRMKDYMYQQVSTMDNDIQIYNNLCNYVSFNQTVIKILEKDYESNYDMYSDFQSLLDPLVASMEYFHGSVDQITLYTDNQIIKYGTTIAPLDEIVEEPWYDIIIADNEIHWFCNQKEQKLFLARVIPTIKQGISRNIVYVEINYEKFFEELTKMSDSNYGLFLVGNYNQILYEHQEFEEKYEMMKVSADEFLNKKDNEDFPYFIVNNRLEQTGWTLYVYRPEIIIQYSTFPVVMISIIIAVIAAVFSILMLIILIRLLVRGIVQLKDTMRKVEEGNLQIQLESESNDEIGELIRGFNKMISKINELIEQVYEGQIRQKDYEMKALQAQINPHFLYNSLSLINWKAIETGQEDISKITLALSSFYRTALNKRNNVLTFGEEIENLRSYLEIQLMMHDYEFDVEIHVEEEVKQYKTLNLILQPMIENAIEHGIDLKMDGRGKITVDLYREGTEIVLKVADNGVGMEEEAIKTILTKQSRGYGLRNVNERIKLYYGEEYHLVITSKIGEGTQITLRVPTI